MTEESVLRKASGWSILWGILLIIFGILAIGSPYLAAVAVTSIIAWLIILAGGAHLIYGFHAKSAGGIVWEILVALAYIVFGIYLLMHPSLGIAALTLLLATLFFIEGILDIIGFFQARRSGGRSGWLLLDGIITLLLAVLIWVHWPSSSAWAIGTLVGVSMIVSGWVRLMISLAVRRLAGSTA